nr:MAG TPA: hypothetical protein [Caudoviricetes sp.]
MKKSHSVKIVEERSNRLQNRKRNVSAVTNVEMNGGMHILIR